MSVEGLSSLLSKIERLNNISVTIQPAVDDVLTQLEGSARDNASGPRPEHIDKVSGNLVNEIQKFGPNIEGNSIVGGVESRAEYSGIHETGGVIEAKNAPYLEFELPDGSFRKVKAVQIPARPFMEPALRSNKDQIVRNLTDTVIGVLR